MEYDGERVHKSPPSLEPCFRTSSINKHTYRRRNNVSQCYCICSAMRKNATRIRRSGATCGRSGCAVLRPLKLQGLLKAC